jgi:hypothetical protein
MTHKELLALIDQAADEGWKELDLSGQGRTRLSAILPRHRFSTQVFYFSQ